LRGVDERSLGVDDPLGAGFWFLQEVVLTVNCTFSPPTSNGQVPVRLSPLLTRALGAREEGCHLPQGRVAGPEDEEPMADLRHDDRGTARRVGPCRDLGRGCDQLAEPTSSVSSDHPSGLSSIAGASNAGFQSRFRGSPAALLRSSTPAQIRSDHQRHAGGTEAVTTIRMDNGSTRYELDLCQSHFDELTGAGRRLRSRRRTGGARSATKAANKTAVAKTRRRGRGGLHTAAVREWARAHGYQVSDRGRIPHHIVEAFTARE
jgi:nucleoid-associated protein Lsr2